MKLATQLRDQLPNLRLQMHMGGGKFNKQMKKAVESGASFALVVNEEKLANGQVGVKPLLDRGEQINLSLENLADWLNENL